MYTWTKGDGQCRLRMGAREACNHCARLLGSVHYGEQTVIVERSGRPLVAIIPVEMYQRPIAEREARFQVLVAEEEK